MGVGCSRRVALAKIGGGIALGLTPGSISAAPGAGVQFSRGILTQGGWAIGRIASNGKVALDGKPVPVDPQGWFLIAFDRDAPATARLDTQLSGLTLGQDLTIAPRQWQIEAIDAPRRPPGVPDAEYQRRRADELAQIAAARARVTAAQGWREAMIRPAPGRVSGRFGAQRIYRGEPGAYHSGLDLAAAAGTPILAPASGVVVLAAPSPFTLEGRLLLLDHGMGLTSAFLHCSAHDVQPGDAVKQGQPIASVGMTGRATGPHLHWGLRWQSARLDPLLFLPAA